MQIHLSSAGPVIVLHTYIVSGVRCEHLFLCRIGAISNVKDSMYLSYRMLPSCVAMALL